MDKRKEFTKGITGELWDRRKKLRGRTAKEIYEKWPQLKEEDVVVMNYSENETDLVPVKNIRIEFPEQTEGLSSEGVKNWYVKRRKAKLCEGIDLDDYKTLGILNHLVLLQTRIIDLESRVGGQHRTDASFGNIYLMAVLYGGFPEDQIPPQYRAAVVNEIERRYKEGELTDETYSKIK